MQFEKMKRMGCPCDVAATLISALKSIDAPITGHVIDHIGLRAGPEQGDYESLCRHYENRGILVGSSMVAGREVKLISLNRPISVAGYEIPDIEILSHKESSHYEMGFEHIEIVCDDLQDLFYQLQCVESDVPFMIDDKNINRDHNPDIRICFRGLEWLSVKYHLAPLKEIVEQEMASK